MFTEIALRTKAGGRDKFYFKCWLYVKEGIRRVLIHPVLCAMGKRDKAAGFPEEHTAAFEYKRDRPLMFESKEMLSFKCHALAIETMSEYSTMISAAVLTLLVGGRPTAADPAPDTGVVVLNIMLQLFLEIPCDLFCLRHEVTVQKLPVLLAWKSRPKYFAFLTMYGGCCIALQAVYSTLRLYCPVREEAGGELIFQYC